MAVQGSATRSAIVTGKHDEGVVGNAQCLELRNDLAHLAIEIRDELVS